MISVRIPDAAIARLEKATGQTASMWLTAIALSMTGEITNEYDSQVKA